MSEQAQTFKIAKIPADGVGREVVEAGQRVLDSVAGQSGAERSGFHLLSRPGA